MTERDATVDETQCWWGATIRAVCGDDTMAKTPKTDDKQPPSDESVNTPCTIGQNEDYDLKYGDRIPASYDAETAGQLLKENELGAENIALCKQVIASWARQFRDTAGPQ